MKYSYPYFTNDGTEALEIKQRAEWGSVRIL